MTLDDLYDYFEEMPDWEDRYRTLIDLGRNLPPMPGELKTEANFVKGCMSQVWFAQRSTDPFDFWADSDSTLVKGLAAILHLIYSGRPRKEISSLDVNAIFKKLDLENHISPNRRNGFYAMVEKIKALGAA